MLCTVDAYVNSDLGKYLMNGSYPTVRVFYKGQQTKSSFLGAKSESFVRSFIDSAIKDPMARSIRQNFQKIETSAKFRELITKAQMPVLVKFSKST